MTDSPTTHPNVVIEDDHVLRVLCGPNDQNLSILEQILGAPIHHRGNEIGLESEDPHIRRVFGYLMEELEEHVRLGHHPSADLVRALVDGIDHAGVEKDVNILKEEWIAIPPGRRVFPRSIRQGEFIRGMEAHDLSFGIGPAGTGKTYLAVAYALGELMSHRKNRLVLTRPVVEAGENLGFLPGDLAQKINPYLRPLYDAMDALISPQMVNKLQETRVIEVAPLAYMRGRSLQDSIIILDEAQNTTRAQMKMFLTRLGEGSKAIITGDVTQIDLPKDSDSGLIEAVRLLESIDEIHVSTFSARDVVRHPLVRTIVRAYEKQR